MLQPCCQNRQLAPVLKEVGQRVLLLTGEGDLLIPSREEGPRLQRLLPRCQLKVALPSRPAPSCLCGACLLLVPCSIASPCAGCMGAARSLLRDPVSPEEGGLCCGGIPLLGHKTIGAQDSLG